MVSEYKHIDHDGIMFFRIWKLWQSAEFRIKIQGVYYCMSINDVRTMLKIMTDLEGRPSEFISEMLRYGVDLKGRYPKESKHLESVRKVLMQYYVKYKEMDR